MGFARILKTKKNRKKTTIMLSIFIGSSTAQCELFLRYMHFITMRKQVHIYFYQFDLQSGTRLTSYFEMFNIF